MALVLNNMQFTVLESTKELVNLMFGGIAMFSFLSDGPST